MIFDKILGFKSSKTNPPFDGITIIELKRPMRKSYPATDDPFKQMQDYIDNIQNGKVTDFEGRLIQKNTPFFCYLICDFTPEIIKQSKSANLTKTPDDEGYFGYWQNYNAYIEVISYTKLLDNAKKRNMAFFQKLGLPT